MIQAIKFNIEEKERALHLLVDKGFITEDEYARCCAALRNEDLVPVPFLNTNECIYKNDDLSVYFQKIIDSEFAFAGGVGHGIEVIIENHTSRKIDRLQATGIQVNGIVVKSDRYLEGNIDPDGKSIGVVTVHYKDTEHIGVRKPLDFNTIAFHLSYQYDGDYHHYDTELISIPVRRLMVEHARVKM